MKTPALLCCLSVLAFVSPAQAQNVWTWTGAGDGTTWSDSTNWTPAGGIVSSSSTQLFYDGSTAFTSSNDETGFTLNSLEVDGTASASSFITGNSLTFANASGTSPSLTESESNAMAATLTISNNLVLDDVLTVQATSGVNGSGEVPLALTGTISGTGSLFIFAPGNVVTLGNANNSFVGGVSLASGSLNIMADGELGDAAGTLTFLGGVLETSTTTTIARPVAMTSGGSNEGFSPDPGTVLTLTGSITGSGPLALVGSGVLVATGTNTSAGSTVTSGTLAVSSDTNLGVVSGTVSVGFATLETTDSFESSRDLYLGDFRSGLYQDAGTTWEMDGVVSGNSFIQLYGPGTLVLRGDDQTFGAIINAGTLVVTGTSEIMAGGAFSVRGGSFYLSNSINCDMDVRAGATFSPGVAPTMPATATTTGTLTLFSGANLGFALGQTSGSGTIDASTVGFAAPTSGTVTVMIYNSGDLGAGTYQLITGPNLNGATAANFALGTTLTGLQATFSVGANGVSVTLAPAGSYSAWAISYFGSDTAPGTLPTDTPQGDRVPNLLKYTYDINPTAPMSATDRAALPTVTVGATTQTLTYRESTTATGITVQAQVSPDLHTWSNVSSTQSGTDPNTNDPIFQAQVTSPTTGGAKQFLRLLVTQP